MLAGMWQRMKDIRQKKALILMYHQVCEKKNDPWELAVHPERFAAQLYYLKRNFDVVSMEELAEAIKRKKISRNMAAITFDDGFADNFNNAVPMLDWLKLPATFYIPTQAVNTNKQYWWDELQCIVLQTESLPEKLAFTVNGETVQFQFRRDHILRGKLTQEIKHWRASMPVPNERVKLYMALWQQLKPLPFDQQHNVLSEIRDWSRVKFIDNSQGAVMRLCDIQSLNKNPLFNIGAHTVSHAMLASQTPSAQAYEVTESKRVLEQWLGTPVSGFAYPYGNYNADTKVLLNQAGFSYAVSTESRLAKVSDNPYELPRVQVKNWSLQQFTAVINQLMN